MDEATMYLNNDYRPYLIHHGVPGQKWGVRKAAWYPISAFQKAKATVGSKVAEFRQKRAAEKKRKQRVANLAKARATRAAKLKEEKDFAEEKKRILTSGTPGEVLKISSKLTDKEIQDATIRNKNLENLRNMEETRIKRVKAEEFNRKYGKYIKMVETAKLVGGYANDVGNAYKNVKNLLDVFGKKGDDDAPKDKSKDQSQNTKGQTDNGKKPDNGKAPRNEKGILEKTKVSDSINPFDKRSDERNSDSKAGQDAFDTLFKYVNNDNSQVSSNRSFFDNSSDKKSNIVKNRSDSESNPSNRQSLKLDIIQKSRINRTESPSFKSILDDFDASDRSINSYSNSDFSDIFEAFDDKRRSNR